MNTRGRPRKQSNTNTKYNEEDTLLNDENIFCNVCGDGDWTDDDKIVGCERCGIIAILCILFR